MELYLDSADFNEIEKVFKLGFLDGLTTTPTFMHRHGVTDIDALILKLAEIVPVLQVEALGKTADEIYTEAHRLLDMGLKKDRSVFKIPISLEGVKACKMLTDEGIMVNVHLVYTLQQAYMAMHAGATYVCPLVGRLQDQGHDALALVEQCVDAVNYYGYDTKIMFSSVRNVEHVRNAINIGVHTITVPYKILQQMPENNFTAIGTEQFFEHTRLMTVKVKDAMSKTNPIVPADMTLQDALVKMSEYGFGCIIVANGGEQAKGVFTDGDLRRLLQKGGKDVLQKKMSDLEYNTPLSVDANELLFKASELFKTHKVDNLMVTEDGKPIGLLDIQDL
ncbi:MAG: CBS domain-containing protein [Chloroflexia bacterium]|nr:CBS domain-containing protein [Chloroflexia bacterium]